MKTRTLAMSVAAVAGTLALAGFTHADSTGLPSWARPGTRINIGQGSYIVPFSPQQLDQTAAQPAPREEPEGPAIEAGYREGPSVESTVVANHAQPAANPFNSPSVLYRVGNANVLLLDR